MKCGVERHPPRAALPPHLTRVRTLPSEPAASGESERVLGGPYLLPAMRGSLFFFMLMLSVAAWSSLAAAGTVHGCLCRSLADCDSNRPFRRGLRWCETTEPCVQQDNQEYDWDFCETHEKAQAGRDMCEMFTERGFDTRCPENKPPAPGIAAGLFTVLVRVHRAPVSHVSIPWKSTPFRPLCATSDSVADHAGMEAVRGSL